MRTLLNVVVAAAAGLLVAPVSAQTCLWTARGQQYPIGDGVGVYHAGFQRVLFLVTSRYALTAVEIWAWDGASWTLLDNTGPSRRGNTSVAYDSARNRLVLFGGYNGTNLRDTWEWNGDTWALVSNTGPSARFGHAMTYDAARQRTVLFGGATVPDPLTYLGDTWEWDGNAWDLAATTGPSPQVAGPTFAYDSQRARSVFYSSPQTSPTPELWEWNGAVWTLRSITGPHPGVHWMVYDPGRARMIASQPPVSGVTHPGTWELNPATAEWQFNAPGSYPYGPGTFDIARSRVVANWWNQTWEYEGTASAVAPYVFGQPVGGEYPIGGTVVLNVDAFGTNPAYQWRHNGQPLANGGHISGADTSRLTLSPAAAADTGAYDVVVSNTCGSATSTAAYVQVGPPPPSPCYPNCDESTTQPILNIADFTCFLQRFAAGDPYANCDRGYTPPVLNVGDFTCFLQRFTAGCP
jgi:hypothetical protein